MNEKVSNDSIEKFSGYFNWLNPFNLRTKQSVLKTVVEFLHLIGISGNIVHSSLEHILFLTGLPVANVRSRVGFRLPYGLPAEFLRGLTGANSLCADKQNEPSRCADKQNEHSRCADKLTSKINSGG